MDCRLRWIILILLLNSAIIPLHLKLNPLYSQIFGSSVRAVQDNACSRLKAGAQAYFQSFGTQCGVGECLVRSLSGGFRYSVTFLLPGYSNIPKVQYATSCKGTLIPVHPMLCISVSCASLTPLIAIFCVQIQEDLHTEKGISSLVKNVSPFCGSRMAWQVSGDQMEALQTISPEIFSDKKLGLCM